MKRLFIMASMVIALCAFVSCNGNDKQKEEAAPAVEWNVTADASGNGNIVIGFPTGSIQIDGTATVGIGSASENVENIAMVACQEVIENPENYTEQAVEVANEIANKTFFHVDTMSGKWNVNITGYAKVDKIYIVIDEHWPAQEDTTVVE